MVVALVVVAVIVIVVVVLSMVVVMVVDGIARRREGLVLGACPWLWWIGLPGVATVSSSWT